jgi:LPS sulfotransferase NodH
MGTDRCGQPSIGEHVEAGARHAMEVVGRVRHPAPRFDHERDLKWPGQVERTVVVASEVRSGSTLLCHALRETGFVGVPLEYLQAAWFESGFRVLGAPSPTPAERRRRVRDRLMFRRQWWAFNQIQPDTLPAYLEGVVRRRTTRNGVFAINVHWDSYALVRDQDGFSVE